MSLAALVPPRSDSQEFMMVEYGFFILCAAFCFVRVVGYAVEQGRSARLVDGPNSPPRFMISGRIGWAFVVGVMALLFLQSPLYMILVVTGLSVFLMDGRQTAIQQFGLGKLSAPRILKWTLLVCGGVVFVELPLSQIVDRVMTAIHFPHPEQESVEIFRQVSKPSEMIAFLTQAVLISPLIEELFFRGFLFTFLKNYTTTIFALVLSAGVFAFAHANLGSALQLWVLGLALGLAYEHTGSLLLPMGIHACWNFLTAMSLLFDRGGF